VKACQQKTISRTIQCLPKMKIVYHSTSIIAFWSWTISLHFSFFVVWHFGIRVLFVVCDLWDSERKLIYVYVGK